MTTTNHGTSVWDFDSSPEAPEGFSMSLDLDESLRAEALDVIYDIDNADLYEELDIVGLVNLYYVTLNDYLVRVTGRPVSVSASMRQCVVTFHVNEGAPHEFSDDHIAVQVLGWDNGLLSDAVTAVIEYLMTDGWRFMG